MSCNAYHIFFRNLSNPVRIAIISSLKRGDKSVGEIVEELGLEQSKVSHALFSMKRCGLVEYRKEGKKRIYTLNKKTILPILNIIDKHECQSCENGK